jgi:hypothetical protein
MVTILMFQILNAYHQKSFQIQLLERFLMILKLRMSSIIFFVGVGPAILADIDAGQDAQTMNRMF